MLVVPVQAIPWQVFNVSLDGQPCLISIRSRTTGLFLDLTMNNVQIVAGRLCLNSVRIVRDQYLGFVGDLAFYDTQAVPGIETDPEYAGLGTRWVLMYLEAADVASALNV